MALTGCAPTEGWLRTDRRACQPQSAPILCLSGEFEGPYELRVGDRVVLPGECIEGPKDRGGRVRTVLFSSGVEVARRRVSVRAGARTEVRVDGTRVVIEERRRCDGTVPEPSTDP